LNRLFLVLAVSFIIVTGFSLIPDSSAAPVRDVKVLDEDFEGTFDWIPIQNGIVSQVNVGVDAVSGDMVARKTTNNHPHGAFKSFTQQVDDFEAVLYTKKVTDNGGNSNRYSILLESQNNGYGIRYTSSSLVLERVTGYGLTTLASTPVGWDFGNWNTLRLIKIGDNLTLELYKNQIVDPDLLDQTTATVTTIDNTYPGGFGRAIINGGFEFDTDDYMVWNLINDTTPPDVELIQVCGSYCIDGFVLDSDYDFSHGL